MNPHALGVLEFDRALDLVAGFATSPAGARAVRAIQPTSVADRVRWELKLVAQGMDLLRREGGWPTSTLPELGDALGRLKIEGYVWDGPTHRRAASLISAARTARRLLVPLREELGELAGIAEPIGEFQGLGEEIGRAIDDEGEVRDHASPELSRLRREIHSARGRIVARLTDYTASLSPHIQVSDASVGVRDGRYVIAVRREGRGEVGGIVHGESQTGATLFIEPPIAIEMMNRLRELEGEESREVHRILRELTARLRPHAESLEISLAALVRLDTIYARSRYAVSVDGVPPSILETGRGFSIVQGRHPVLLARGETVVPFDLHMEEGERTLVISGPNTGGKTVLLKAIGLITLLAQSGVVPPVAVGTRLALFRDVFADIGDEQSIEASLSTFSAHLKNLRETLLSADGGSLVLIDEIGSGTDPVEGSALARAILVELTARSCFTVATTHLGALKLLATEDRQIVNASLQFDPERLQPTYRLQKGIPGRSYGLAIARRLGLPADVLQRAEEALPSGERDVGRLLLALEAKEQRVTQLDGELQTELARTQSLSEQLQERERDLVRREKDSERRSRQQARDLLMQSRNEVEAAIREVRGAADEATLEEAAKAARRRVEEAARRQREKTPTAPAARTARDAASTEDLRVGARVRIESLGRTGTLLEIRDAKAVVDTGGMRMQLPATDLTMLPAGDQTAVLEKPKPRPSGGRYDADLDASIEIDLRGMRVDELGLRLGRALDNALLAGLPTFRIIHGKGTGALRAEVEDLLRADPRVARFRPGDRFEGGTGVTIAEFR
jgi:DNA mismatch repair protein MutS2